MKRFGTALEIIEKILINDEHRLREIIAGVEGERFHIYDMYRVAPINLDIFLTI